MSSPRIALVHAMPVAVEPIRAAFAAGWSRARTTNLLGEEALAQGTRLRLVSTFAPGIASMVQALDELAVSRGRAVSVRSATVPGAMDDRQNGRADRHDHVVAQACSDFTAVDVLMLAQVSMARAARLMTPVAGRRSLTSPDSAVARLKRELDPSGGQARVRQ